MFPILPSTHMQAEKNRHDPAPANEHEYAQKHGRVVRPSALPASIGHSGDQRSDAVHTSRQSNGPSRARLVLVAALVIITLALLAAFL